MSKISVLILNTLALSVIVFTTIAHSRELLVVSSDGPPHMIAANNSGIDIDIVKNVLMEMGHNVTFKFMPFKRAKLQVQSQKADIFLPTFYQQANDKIFISNAFIHYRPMIFSLKKSGLVLNKISDLKGLRIISFQGATGYFGEEFKEVTTQSRYTESTDMSKLPQLLLLERCDIVVLDYYIFYYFLKKYQEQNEMVNKMLFPLIDNYSPLVKTHDLIPQVNAYAGFNNKTLRDQFDKTLEKFIQNNKHKDIIEKYIGIINSKVIHQSSSVHSD